MCQCHDYVVFLFMSFWEVLFIVYSLKIEITIPFLLFLEFFMQDLHIYPF